VRPGRASHTPRRSAARAWGRQPAQAGLQGCIARITAHARNAGRCDRRSCRCRAGAHLGARRRVAARRCASHWRQEAHHASVPIA
jgi:hypothetical protein